MLLGCANPLALGESGLFSFSISGSSSTSNADIESESDIPRLEVTIPSWPSNLDLVSLKDPFADPLRDVNGLPMSLPCWSGIEGLLGCTSFIEGRRDSAGVNAPTDAGVGGPSCP